MSHVIQRLSLPGICVLGLLTVSSKFSHAAVPPAPFGGSVSFEVAQSEPQDVVAADFNADHHLDLAIAAYGSDSDPGAVTVLLNDGAGGFADNYELSTGLRPYGLAAADFNHDGRDDLASVQGGGGSTSVYVYTSNGNGTFTQKQILTAGAFPISAVAGLFNADVHVDVAVANNVSGGI